MKISRYITSYSHILYNIEGHSPPLHHHRLRLSAGDSLRSVTAIGGDVGHQGARDSQDRREGHREVQVPVLRRLYSSRGYLHLQVGSTLVFSFCYDKFMYGLRLSNLEQGGSSQGYRKGRADVPGHAVERAGLNSRVRK